MRFWTFFKLYKICVRLHRSKLKIKNQFKYQQCFSKIFSRFFSNFCKIKNNRKICENVICRISNVQLDNLIVISIKSEKRVFSIYLQRSVLIHTKTSNISPKFCRSAVVSPHEFAGRRRAGRALAGREFRSLWSRAAFATCRRLPPTVTVKRSPFSGSLRDHQFSNSFFVQLFSWLSVFHEQRFVGTETPITLTSGDNYFQSI